MDRAVSAWLAQQSISANQHATFIKKLQKSYVVYGCMVLLPTNTFTQREAETCLTPAELEHLYKFIALHLKITHIAISRPIPLHDLGNDAEENLMRSPSNFTPLFGEFGQSTCSKPPTQADFDDALWVSTKQNGIYQTWSPRWTMFSRGNISEKTRLLGLDSIVGAVQHGEEDGKGCSAVDLYVGIGYFAFSYAKAGVRKVLGWDLNAWSCEGMQRGAKANKWKAVLMCADGSEMLGAAENAETRFLMFNESNEQAAARIERMRSRLPPIRHVNCGLLPTSRGSWQTAVEVLDAKMGGWVHVHENFAIDEIERRSVEVRAAFQTLVASQEDSERRVELQHVNRLKSYAPGVIHCVLDIYISPSTHAI